MYTLLNALKISLRAVLNMAMGIFNKDKDSTSTDSIGKNRYRFATLTDLPIINLPYTEFQLHLTQV